MKKKLFFIPAFFLSICLPSFAAEAEPGIQCLKEIACRYVDDQKDPDVQLVAYSPEDRSAYDALIDEIHAQADQVHLHIRYRDVQGRDQTDESQLWNALLRKSVVDRSESELKSLLKEKREVIRDAHDSCYEAMMSFVLSFNFCEGKPQKKRNKR